MRLPRMIAAMAVVCALLDTTRAATYYVDATAGSDSNSGLLPSSAWMTIAKVNASTFAPGDQILFKRGEIWRESLVPPSSGTSGNPIKLDAYSTGDPPTITGHLPLLATAWSLDSGSIWKATVNGTTMSWVLFGSIWGVKQTAKNSVVADRDFYFASNTLYVYSLGNPVTYYGSVAAMLMPNGQLIYIDGKSYLELQHLKLTYFDSYGLRVGGAADHLTFANIYVDGQIPAGALPHGLYVNSTASPADISFYNVDAHRNYNGFRFDGVATLIRVTNSRAYANRNKGLEDNTGVASYSYCHFYANNVAIFSSQDVTGGVDAGHNLAPDTWPAVNGFTRYPARVSFTVDDIGLAAGADTYVDSLLPVFDARGVKISAAVTAGYASGVIAKLQSWFNAGHDLNAHSWSHQYYTNLNAFTVVYTGTGTAATLAISANHLTTTITGGPGGENLNLDLTNTTYDTISKVVSTINSRGVYTATQDANCQGGVHSIALSDVSAQNIKTVYTATLQKGRLIPDEMSSSRNWLQSNVTGLSNVKVYVYPAGLEDTETQGWAVTAGYEGARGGLSMGLGSKHVYSLGVNIQDITSFGTSGLHNLTAEQIDAKIAALVFKASVWGAPYGLFCHKDELTSGEIAQVLDALINRGATVMTNTQLIDAIYATSQVGTTTNYVSAASGPDADFRPAAASPVVNAGTTLDPAYRFDALGIDQSAFGSAWEIGSFTYLGASPFVILVN